jgi:hypothetical protein
MADDKSRTDGRDRAKVAGDEEYEVGYLASSTGISLDQARELIERHGNNREVLEAAAKLLKST